MDQTVYFGNLENSNKSISRINCLNDHDIIHCNLDSVSQNVRAFFFVVNVATHDKTLEDVQTASMRIIDTESGIYMYEFIPDCGGANFNLNTSIFLMRLTRDNKNWTMSIIGDMDDTARDFGTLIPQIKSYSRDLCPGIKVNPMERLKIMRRDSVIRLQDHNHGAPFDQELSFRFSWDDAKQQTNMRVGILCYDTNKELCDMYGDQQLTSHNRSIVHEGHWQRERKDIKRQSGENVCLNLRKLDANINYVGFVINAYSGLHLDHIGKVKFRLSDENSGLDVAEYEMQNDNSVDKYAGIIFAYIYRSNTEDWWKLRVLGRTAEGTCAVGLYTNLGDILCNEPPPEPKFVEESEIVENEMPEFLYRHKQELVLENPFAR